MQPGPQSIAFDYPRAFYVRSIVFTRYGHKYALQMEKGARVRFFEDILDDAKRFMQLAPSDPRAYTAYCLALVNSGVSKHEPRKFQLAIDICNKILAIEGLKNIDRGHAFTYRGAARLQQGDLNGALNDFNDAINLIPDSPIPFANRAMYWKRVGRPDREKQDLEAAEKNVQGRLGEFGDN